MKKTKTLILLAGLVPLLASCGKASNKFCLALGGEGVPVGQYASKILEYFKLDEVELAKKGLITYGSNVKDVTTKVSQNLVSAGIIYQTDAFSAKLKVVDTATEEMCGQVIYPAAVINLTNNYDAANSFLSYLQGEEALTVFEGVGFSRVNSAKEEVEQVKDSVTLKIFAAASLTETLNEIKDKYEAKHSNITLEMNFGSSGALQKQIESAGKGDCDIFISAAQTQMNNLENANLVHTETRVNLLENKVALAVPNGNPFNITSFTVLKEKLLSELEK